MAPVKQPLKQPRTPPPRPAAAVARESDTQLAFEASCAKERAEASTALLRTPLLSPRPIPPPPTTASNVALQRCETARARADGEALAASKQLALLQAHFDDRCSYLRHALEEQTARAVSAEEHLRASRAELAEAQREAAAAAAAAEQRRLDDTAQWQAMQAAQQAMVQEAQELHAERARADSPQEQLEAQARQDAKRLMVRAGR